MSEPLSDLERDHLRSLLGPISYSDDLVFHHLAHSARNPVTERQLFVALVRHLVEDREQLRKQAFALMAAQPVTIPLGERFTFEEVSEAIATIRERRLRE